MLPPKGRPLVRAAIVFFLVGYCGVPQAWSQPGVKPTGTTGVGGQVELVRLIDLAADRLGVRIDYDAKAVNGAVTIRDKAGLSDQELWSLLNEQLAAREQTTVRAVESRGFSVVKLSAAAQSTRAVQANSVEELREKLGIAPWPGYVVVQAAARNRKAASLVKALQATAGNAIQLSSLFNSSAGGSPSTAGGLGFTGAVLNPGDFTAVLRAFEAINEGRSTSIPRVLVGNNQEATFNSVAQQPTSTVSTDTTSTTTRGFGGFQDAGTKIRIKPQIADGDRLVLTYNVELSSFTSKPEGGLPGAKQQNTIASIATIPDGHTVVVGGLELSTETNDESRVPLIGEIPLFGELFKSRSKTHDRTRFYVFIRANVLRDSEFEDLRYVSARRLDDIGPGTEGTPTIDDGCPKVAPRVIR